MSRKIFTAFLAILSVYAQGQSGYSNLARQTERLQALAKTYPQYAKLRSLTKTAGGRDVWQITIGSGNTESKPGVVVVGGVEGSHLLGTELAIGFAENLLQASTTDSVHTLLQNTTFYIFPNMSPDASEQYFSKIRYERQGNSTTTDDDRDGRMDEDPFDDLDGNGRITQMRVVSPVGDYKLHPDDSRVLIRADINKGEKGTYLIFSEGSDNDRDGLFNEDGEGGVWFNRNFSYKHPSFTAGAGEFAVSELENRALLDYLFDLFNVYAVVSFGTNNNLSTPYIYNPTTANQPLIGSWLQQDVKVDSMVSELYNRTVVAKEAPKTTPAGGDFLSWAYFHYGRFSFSTPGWWVPRSKPDTAKGEKPFTVEDPLANYLRWAAQQNEASNFTEWKKVQHPDFPNQVVEVGGVDPFILINPPAKLLPDLVKKHTLFIQRLATYQPQIDIINVKTEKISNGFTRVTVDVVNKGAISSHTKLGERNYWVKRLNVKLTTGSNQSLISGRKIQTLTSLEGYSTKQLTWLVKGNGKITITAASPTTGTKTIDVTL